MTRRALFAIFLCCYLSLPASAVTAQEQRRVFANYGLLQACDQPVSDAYSVHYIGAFAGNLSAHLKLTFTGTDVTGTLTYLDSEWPRPFNLVGSLASNGELVLSESKNDGSAKIGLMTGTFSGDYNDTFTGMWDNKMGNSMPFVFTRSATYGTFTSSEGPLITDSAGIHQPAVIASIEYPRFLAPAFAPFNQAQAGRARRDWNNIQTASNRALVDTTAGSGPRRDLRVRRTFIYYADDALVGMLTLEYSETGNPPRSGRAWLTENYQFTDRQPRRINLPDLFRDGTPWVARLSSLCRAELSRQGGANVPPLLTANDLQAFLLSPVGLLLWFDPGLVTDESQGDFRVIVPWREIADLIDRNGPAARFLSNY